MARYCPYCTSKIEQGTHCPNCSHEGSYRPKPHHLMPGSLLNNRYLVGTVLGEGGFGITYQGRDLALDMKVAIKEYFPAAFASRTSEMSSTITVKNTADQENFTGGKNRVIREARAMAKMEKEDAVVTVRDYFEANNSAYIVMEFVQGKDLRMMLKEQHKPLDANELLNLLEPVFKALNNLHRQGLIHRDISPDNIMVENNTARLIDFGCTQSAVNTGMDMAALKHYFSPIEQYRNAGMGPWTDEYAMAATIYYCITGKLPPKVMDRLEKDTLQPPSALGVKLKPRQEKALMRALSVKPGDRFPTMEEFGKQLFIHRNKTKLIAIAACAAAVLTVATVLILKRPQVVYTEEDTPKQVLSVRDDVSEDMQERIALLEEALQEGTTLRKGESSGYVLELENSSGKDFELASIRVVLQRDDTVMQTTNVNSGLWEDGNTLEAKISYYGEDITDATVQVTFIEDGQRYQTGTIPVSVESANTVAAVGKLPIRVTYTDYSGTKTQYEISKIECKVSSGSDITVYLSGEKTDGPDDTEGKVRYILWSEDGDVISEGEISLPKMSAGDNFENVPSRYIDHPGGNIELEIRSLSKK